MLKRVTGNGSGGTSNEVGTSSKVRAKVVAELISNESVVVLFVSEPAGKDRMAMQAVIWKGKGICFRFMKRII